MLLFLSASKVDTPVRLSCYWRKHFVSIPCPIPQEVRSPNWFFKWLRPGKRGYIAQARWLKALACVRQETTPWCHHQLTSWRPPNFDLSGTRTNISSWTELNKSPTLWTIGEVRKSKRYIRLSIMLASCNWKTFLTDLRAVLHSSAFQWFQC